MRFSIFVAMCFLLHAGTARAGEDWVCDKARDNAAHIACADQEFRKYDAELNRVYQELINSLADETQLQPGYGPPPLQALRESQRAWLVFRDANCHWKSTSFYGGTGQGVIAVSCRALATRARVAELKAALEP